MRTIKYRGKVDGVWWYASPDDNLHRWTQLWEMAARETVGQFTGLKDRSGKEAYQDDLVRLFGRSIYRIEWDEDYARFQLRWISGEYELNDIHDMLLIRYGEIIGNVHDNPERLKTE